MNSRGIKDVLCVHTMLEDVQFHHLKMIFIQKRVWDIMWNQMSWTGFYPGAFGKAMLVNGARLKAYLIKIALYSAAEEYSYEELEKDIFIGGVRGPGGRDGVVIRELKQRLNRMKCVFQRKEGEGLQTELTNNEFWECEAKLWPYLANEKVQPD
jgi:hypothetical protein